MTLVRTGQRWATAQTAPEAYAHRVLINLLHDRHRGLARRVTERPLDGHDEGRSPLRDHADTVADRDAIVQAVRRLPARQREVVVLRFFADLTVGETAAATGPRRAAHHGLGCGDGGRRRHGSPARPLGPPDDPGRRFPRSPPARVPSRPRRPIPIPGAAGRGI
jgi:hypothetical protein